MWKKFNSVILSLQNGFLNVLLVYLKQKKKTKTKKKKNTLLHISQ